MKKVTIDNYLDNHYINRSNWLRAAVLGANDGIISISSLAIGVAAASSLRDPIIIATVAGLVAHERHGILALWIHNSFSWHFGSHFGKNRRFKHE